MNETNKATSKTTREVKTDKSFYQVCDKLRSSPYGIEVLCATNKASYADLVNWVSPFSANYDHEKADYYRKAKMDQKRYLADSLLTLTEKMHVLVNGAKQSKSTCIQVQVLKLRIETIKWFLGEAKGRKPVPNRRPMPEIII